MSEFALPSSPAAFADASWDDILPFFDALAARPLDRATVEAWLRDWSALDELLTEAQLPLLDKVPSP